MPSLLIASPHRYPDLARLWHRSVARELVPAFLSAGFECRILIFRDSNPTGFDPAHFPGVEFDDPRPGARDFIEFYDSTLARGCEYVLFLDADVFFLEGRWPISHLGVFDDPGVAAISFLHRPDIPGSIYALMCRSDAYRLLPPPVLAACYERAEDWPDAIHRDPGERAAIRLREMGMKIHEASPSEAEDHLADFHGTTNVRASREIFGGIIGAARFESLLTWKTYFAKGGYDNFLLGLLYEAVFGEPFAVGDDGRALGASFPVESMKRALDRIDDPAVRRQLWAYSRRSNRNILRLAAREGLPLSIPNLIPDRWAEAMND